MKNIFKSLLGRQKRCANAVAALALTMFMSNALTQGIPVYDNAGLINDIKNFATTIEQYGKEAQHYVDTAKRWTQTAKQYVSVVQHYEQQLINLKNMNFTLQLMKNDFRPRDPAKDIQTFCPGSTANILDITSMLKQFAANLGGDIAQQQREICSQIVQLRDFKYNDTVTLIDTLKEYTNNEYRQLDAQRNSVGTGEGALQANSNETMRYVARMNTEINTWHSKALGYDMQIAFLKQQQDALARRAFNGDPAKGNDILVQGAQALALKVAFETLGK